MTDMWLFKIREGRVRFSGVLFSEAFKMDKRTLKSTCGRCTPVTASLQWSRICLRKTKEMLHRAHRRTHTQTHTWIHLCKFSWDPPYFIAQNRTSIMH